LSVLKSIKTDPKIYSKFNIHNRKSFDWFLSFYPFLNEHVNFFSVNYTEDENTVTGNFENNTVISDSQLPVSFKGSSQRLSIGFRLCGKPFFDGSLDHALVFRVYFGQVRSFDVRMVFEFVCHCLSTRVGS